MIACYGYANLRYLVAEHSIAQVRSYVLQNSVPIFGSVMYYFFKNLNFFRVDMSWLSVFVRMPSPVNYTTAHLFVLVEFALKTH